GEGKDARVERAGDPRPHRRALEVLRRPHLASWLGQGFPDRAARSGPGSRPSRRTAELATAGPAPRHGAARPSADHCLPSRSRRRGHAASGGPLRGLLHERRGDRPAAALRPRGDPSRPARPDPPPLTRYFEDFRVGETVDLGSVQVSQADIIAFASQYDPQPMHLDPNAASFTIYGGLIASGWHTGALFMGLLVRRLIAPTNRLGTPAVGGMPSPAAGRAG